MNNKLARKGSILEWINKNEWPTPFEGIFDYFLKTEWPDFDEKFGINFVEKHAYPKVNLIDENDKFIIEAEIVGLTKDDVRIKIKDDVLSISGEKRDRKEETDKKRNYIRKEIKHSSFCRSFLLNNNIETDKISAEFKNNLLKIVLPKREEIKKIDKFTEIKID